LPSQAAQRDSEPPPRASFAKKKDAEFTSLSPEPAMTPTCSVTPLSMTLSSVEKKS
jgi:hypothetical protein